MRKLRNTYLATLAVLLSPIAANAAPIKSTTATTSGGTLITFEEFGPQADADTLYAPQGVVFSTVSGNPSYIFSEPTWATAASSSPYMLGVNSEPSGLFLAFDAAQSSVEFWFSDGAPLADWTFSAIDSGGTTLETLVLTQAEGSSQDWYIGFSRAAGDIFSISVIPDDILDAFGIDDLRFVAAGSSEPDTMEPGTVVPEPGTLALLGLGLAGMGFTRRKKS